ncbi:hypothetical protein EV646_112140 [Kribbella antiqua]|uniref:Uncharacterized protein n=1 Tax=Kribbella antiqua TaxID=2512217 RepID=A0A4R2IFT6_9ACTN|nr:hypothetical protein [Kribbella antiqua]TCO43564.1 hypothetical protein EV646_112140 [Kribbella antiqua]
MHERQGQETQERKPAPQPVTTPTDDRGLLDLQRTAGNAAVAAAMSTDAVWRPPPDFVIEDRGSCATGEDVALTLGAWANNVYGQANALTGERADAVRTVANAARDMSVDFAPKASLTQQDIGVLTAFATTATGLVQARIREAAQEFASALVLPDIDETKNNDLLADLAEQAHLAFIDTSAQDKLGQLIGLIKQAKAANDQVKEYAGKVEKVSKQLQILQGAVKIGQLAKELQELNKRLGEQIEEAKKSVELAREIATVLGVDNTSNGTEMMQGIRQFQAAFGLVDRVIGSPLGEAVPIFGDLWKKWYKPMVDACFKQLAIIAKYDEAEKRNEAIFETMTNGPRNAGGAPIITEELMKKNYFPGGQPVFDYVHAVRGERPAVMTEEVRKYFIDRQDQFNIKEDDGNQIKVESFSLFDTGTWHFKENRKSNLESWIAKNIDKVWALLYGENGRYIGY